MLQLDQVKMFFLNLFQYLSFTLKVIYFCLTNKESLTYSKELEEDVDKCIQGLFKSSSTNSPSLTVEEFISILSKLQDSQDKKDKVSCLFKVQEQNLLQKAIFD